MLRRTELHASVMAGVLAREATRLLLDPRETVLGKRAPRDRRIHQTRRKIACGQATPFEMVILQSLTDLADGVPAQLAARPYLNIARALLLLAAPPRVVAAVPPLALVQHETRAEHAMNEAQHAVLANPDCPAALETYLARSAEYDAAQERMDAWALERRQRLTLLPAAG
jgi:hypothetical protein